MKVQMILQVGPCTAYCQWVIMQICSQLELLSPSIQGASNEPPEMDFEQGEYKPWPRWLSVHFAVKSIVMCFRQSQDAYKRIYKRRAIFDVVYLNKAQLSRHMLYKEHQSTCHIGQPIQLFNDIHNLCLRNELDWRLWLV